MEKPPNPPNVTLYCRNLDDRIHQDALRANLYEFFISYGEVIAVQAIHSKKLRGQAFVTFRDINAASQAMKALQGAMFLDKPIIIAFAKSKSEVASVVDGTVKLKKRKVAEEPTKAE